MMTRTISSAHARLQFAELLGRVAWGGDEYVITRKGKPVARLVPLQPSGTPTATAGKPWVGLDDDDVFFKTLERIRKVPLRSKPRRR